MARARPWVVLAAAGTLLGLWLLSRRKGKPREGKESREERRGRGGGRYPPPKMLEPIEREPGVPPPPKEEKPRIIPKPREKPGKPGKPPVKPLPIERKPGGEREECVKIGEKELDGSICDVIQCGEKVRWECRAKPSPPPSLNVPWKQIASLIGRGRVITVKPGHPKFNAAHNCGFWLVKGNESWVRKWCLEEGGINYVSNPAACKQICYNGRRVLNPTDGPPDIIQMLNEWIKRNCGC